MKARHAGASYAQALFALAKERNQTSIVSRELGEVAAMCAQRSDLREFLARPSLPRTAKRAAAVDICRRAGLSALIGDFLALIAERGRAREVGAIAEKYEKLLDADVGRVRARVRTAVALTDAERCRLRANLSTALGADQVVLDEMVDPTLLGGFVVENDTILVDGSLKGQLKAIRHRLVAGPGAGGTGR